MNHYKYRLWTVIFLFACMLCSACGDSHSQVYLENTETEETVVMEETDADSKQSVVFVCGAVLCPGLYEFEGEKRVYDAICAAGGLLDEADPNFWNQAEYLTDGMKLYIPTKEEVIDNAVSQGGETSNDFRVDLNKASKEELMTIPGVGATRADQIIAYRRDVGMFHSVEDVKAVSGIKDGLYEKMKDYIKVE